MASYNYNTDYETVAASQTNQTLGPTGAAGDLLNKVIITVTTAATGTVMIKDGSLSAFNLTAANTPIGVYTVDMGARSVDGAWKVTTGAGASVVAVGKFT